MSTKNVASGRVEEKSTEVPAVNWREEVADELLKTSAEMLMLVQRIENRTAMMATRLEDMDSRVASGKGAGKRVVESKPNIRNTLMSMLLKGWVTETEAIEKTGWQTIGVRSFITKQRSNGLSIEQEERDGVLRWRIKTA